MTANTKRVVFTMGGKGGVGKTGVMVALAEWFEENQIPVTLLDLDTENKARGSLQHFFNGRSPKSISTRPPDSMPSSIISMAARPSFLPTWEQAPGRLRPTGSSRCTTMSLQPGVRFTAVGVVTPDPASVESVLAWANRLQERVEYVIVENATSALADFTYWKSTEQANRFREAFSPEILQMEFRLAELENPVRQHGIQLGQVADRKTDVDELKRASLVMRAQSYRRRLFSEFDRARQVFLP